MVIAHILFSLFPLALAEIEMGRVGRFREGFGAGYSTESTVI
jgi:hypothetical protein